MCTRTHTATSLFTWSNAGRCEILRQALQSGTILRNLLVQLFFAEVVPSGLLFGIIKRHQVLRRRRNMLRLAVRHVHRNVSDLYRALRATVYNCMRKQPLHMHHAVLGCCT